MGFSFKRLGGKLKNNMAHKRAKRVYGKVANRFKKPTDLKARAQAAKALGTHGVDV